MRNNEKNKLIKKFIDEVKKAYKEDIVLGYEYDTLVNQYNIWHNKVDFQSTDKEIMHSIGLLMKQLLFDKGIFDFYFAYDSSKAREVKHKNKIEHGITYSLNQRRYRFGNVNVDSKISYKQVSNKEYDLGFCYSSDLPACESIDYKEAV